MAYAYYEKEMANTAKHVGPLSYTSDDILIYMLYVTKFDSSLNFLSKYFAIFGKLESIEVVIATDYFFRPMRYALVSYMNAESASKALRHKNHIFARQKITVEIVKGSQQPFQIKRNFNNEENNLDLDNSYSNLSILDLNDDCLLMIFKPLSFKDHVNMSAVCSRLKFIFQLFYKTKKAISFVPEESFSDIEYSEALQIIGHQINHFSCKLSMMLYLTKEFFLEPMLKFCPNLHTLHLEWFFLKLSEILEISKFKTITHLELINAGLDDQMVEVLSNMSAIEYLNLSKNYDMTGLHLEKFKDVKFLSLSQLYNLQLNSFRKICNKTTKLKVLNINGCHLVNGFAIRTLIENSIDLETLTISIFNITSDLNQISQLSNLKNLIILNGTSPEIFFSALAENENIETLKIFSSKEIKANCILKFKNLKQLDLPFLFNLGPLIKDIIKMRNLKIFNIPNETLCENYVLKYLKQSPSIEFVNLSYNLNYNDNFVNEIINILKKQNRTKPLTLNFKATGVSLDIKEKDFMKENENILKIDMDENEFDPEQIENDYGIKIEQAYYIPSDVI